jgi:hypothetical protein
LFVRSPDAISGVEDIFEHVVKRLSGAFAAS